MKIDISKSRSEWAKDFCDPRVAYKYVPSRYVGDFISNGQLSLGSFSYYKGLEGDVRADAGEGVGFSFVNLSGYNYHVSDSVTVYEKDDAMLCFSKRRDSKLAKRFESVCVRVDDVHEFSRRTVRSLCQIREYAKWALPTFYNFGHVLYGNRTLQVTNDVPEIDVMFVKPLAYREEAEFRVVFNLPHSLRHVRFQKIINIGPLHDLCRVVSCRTSPSSRVWYGPDDVVFGDGSRSGLVGGKWERDSKGRWHKGLG